MISSTVYQIIILLSVLALSYTVESVLGFAGSVIAVTVLSLFLPVQEAVAIVPIAAAAASITILITDWKSTRISAAFRAVAWSMPGILAGSYLISFVPDYLARLVISGLTVFYGLNILINRSAPRLRIPVPVKLIVAGIAIGISSIGVLYVEPVLSGSNNKSSARSTMALLWLVLAVIRLPIYISRGVLNLSQIISAGVAIPFIAFGVVFGYMFHQKIPEHIFRKTLGGVLIGAGVLVIVPVCF